MIELLDIEWTDPRSMHDALDVCERRGGTATVRVPIKDDGYWLEITIKIPITSVPLQVHYEGQILEYVLGRDYIEGSTVTFHMKSKLTGHSYNVSEERAREFSRFIDRDPGRAAPEQ